MHDRLRANGIKHYGGRPLKDGEEFIAEAKFTVALVKLGLATLLEHDVAAPNGTAKARKAKRHYRTRDLTAER